MSTSSTDAREDIAWHRVLVGLCAMALMLGCTWSARGAGYFIVGPLASLDRVTSVIVFVVLAWSWNPLGLTVGRLLGVSCATCVLHVSCAILSLVVGDASSALALQVVSEVLGGFVFSSVCLVFLFICAHLSPRLGGVLVAVAFTLATLYDTVAMLLPQPACLAQCLAGKVVALAAVIWAARGLVLRTSGGEPTLEDGVLPERAVEPSWRHCGQLGPFMFYCVVVLLGWGVLSGVVGFGGAGDNAYFGASSGILMLVVRLAVVGVCSLGTLLKPAPIVSVTLVFWVCSLWLTVLPVAEMTVAADLLRESVYYSLQVFPLVLALRVPEENRVFALCIASAASSSNHVTRMLYPLIGDFADPLAPVACASIACVIAVLVGLWTVTREPSGDLTDRVSMRSDSVEVPCAHDASWAYEADFCRRFNEICMEVSLTARERAVMLRAVHGYTIDNIASNLGVSRETVKTELSRAYARAGVSGKQAFLARMDEGK